MIEIDTIVEEVRQIREEHAKKFDYDPEAIFADIKKQEEQSKRNFISFPAKRIVPKSEQTSQSEYIT